MARKTISQRIQANVLLKSRRRCCICFGLNRDTSIKQGQIAHLDHDHSNDNENNLAFLCFDHHDQYDSKTRQSKNFTKLEIQHFREELISSINIAFSGFTNFGEASTEIKENIDNDEIIIGHYIRDGEYESADITIRQLEDKRYHIEGTALWGITRKFGPNIGELDFIGELIDDKINYSSNYNLDMSHILTLTFQEDKLIISEENYLGLYGMNVTFEGIYHKALAK